jgi:uncharacterized membrane protein
LDTRGVIKILVISNMKLREHTILITNIIVLVMVVIFIINSDKFYLLSLPMLLVSLVLEKIQSNYKSEKELEEKYRKEREWNQKI